jgi:hypothetical protein
LPNGDVEVKTAPEGHLLICRANLGIDFEMRGEVELVHSPSGDVFHAGVAYGEVEYFGSLWNSFRLQRTHTDGAQATVAQLWRGEAITHPAKLNATVNTFQLRSESDYANGTVNGALAIQLAKFKTPSQFSTNYFRLALGADGDGSETVLRYRHIQVRQLHPAKLAR